jgi:hypothetical protein
MQSGIWAGINTLGPNPINTPTIRTRDVKGYFVVPEPISKNHPLFPAPNATFATTPVPFPDPDNVEQKHYMIQKQSFCGQKADGGYILELYPRILKTRTETVSVISVDFTRMRQNTLEARQGRYDAI